MSLGEGCIHYRTLHIKTFPMMCTGFNRLNVKKYLLDVHHDIFDVLIIENLDLSCSEWDSLKIYIAAARCAGKKVVLTNCHVYLDDQFGHEFYKKEPTKEYLEKYTDKDEDGVFFHDKKVVNAREKDMISIFDIMTDMLEKQDVDD